MGIGHLPAPFVLAPAGFEIPQRELEEGKVQMGLGITTVDILVCCKGRFIGIECKRPGAKITLAQQLVLNKIERAGGKVLLIDSQEKADAITADSLTR